MIYLFSDEEDEERENNLDDVMQTSDTEETNRTVRNPPNQNPDDEFNFDQYDEEGRFSLNIFKTNLKLYHI